MVACERGIREPLLFKKIFLKYTDDKINEVKMEKNILPTPIQTPEQIKSLIFLPHPEGHIISCNTLVKKKKIVLDQCYGEMLL